MDGDGDATKQRHQETALDPVKMDWQIFRGPPDFTHVSLPAIFINNANTFVKMYEQAFVSHLRTNRFTLRHRVISTQTQLV